MKPGPAYPGDDQEHLAEPKHLKADDPGECPRPRGCKCLWTPGSVGWFRGPHPKCTANH